jgi:hypothetical protein
MRPHVLPSPPLLHSIIYDSSATPLCIQVLMFEATAAIHSEQNRGCRSRHQAELVCG